MAYNEFAYFYDEFNGAADYDALFRYITGELAAHGVTEGILADLGCGTGDLTLMLTQAGYDVIGIDRSEEMLSVLREKADELEQWKEGFAYDRLGLDEQSISILGVQLPTMTIPVQPGRNLAVIIEVATMNNRHKKMGYNAALELTNQLSQHMEQQNGRGVS